jgi:hypothetical protein
MLWALLRELRAAVHDAKASWTRHRDGRCSACGGVGLGAPACPESLQLWREWRKAVERLEARERLAARYRGELLELGRRERVTLRRLEPEGDTSAWWWWWTPGRWR